MLGNLTGTHLTMKLIDFLVNLQRFEKGEPFGLKTFCLRFNPSVLCNVYVLCIFALQWDIMCVFVQLQSTPSPRIMRISTSAIFYLCTR